MALVTGAARGIGEGIARRLAEDGVRVALSDVNVEGAQGVATAINEADGSAIAIEHDVSQREAWEAVVARTTEAFGSLDIVVNNAGITRDHTLLKMMDEDWDLVVNVHLRGCFYGCQLGLAAMKERGWGRIINITSQSSLGAFGQANYAAAKAASLASPRPWPWRARATASCATPSRREP